MRDRRDRRGRFQHPRKRKTETSERETVNVDENTERDQWSKEARAGLKEAREIRTSGDKHFFLNLRRKTSAQCRTKNIIQY